MNPTAQANARSDEAQSFGFQATNRTSEQDGQHFFEPRTLLLGLFRRWPILIIFAIGFSLLGILVGLKFGSRSYVATTTMLYKPPEDGGRSALRSVLADMPTLLRMAKLQPNLAEVRRRLELSVSLDELDRICEVENPRGSAMLIFTARQPLGEAAASIANTLRDVFVENQESVRKATLGREVRDLEDRLAVIRRQWESAENSLRNFLASHHMIDPNLGAEGYIHELAVLDQLFQQAIAERESGPALGERAGPRYPRLGLEGLPSRDPHGLSHVNARLQNLIQAIQEERVYQVNLAAFEAARSEFEQAEELKKRGLISEIEYRAARARYEREKALNTDSERITAWKQELAEVLTQRVEGLEQARDELKRKIEALPQLQRQYIELSREVAFREGVKNTLEEQLAWVRQAFESNVPVFTVISNAAVPVIPDSSSRKLLAIGIALAGSILGFVVILGLELLDTTIKSTADFSLKFSLPLAGVLPEAPSGEPVFPDGVESELTERFRLMARCIRQKVPKRGARIMVVSATEGEGTTSIAANLAMCFGRQDERVLLLDAQVRGGEHECDLRDLISNDTPQLKGLGEYLSFEAHCLKEIVWPTYLPGVSCVPRIGEAVIPDLVGSNRMEELLEEASLNYSIVLIDTPPIHRFADGQSLVRWADAVVLVIKSRHLRFPVIRDALQRLQAMGSSNILAVLNRVSSLYL